MRKVSDKPAELKRKITAKEGFELMLDLRNGKLSKRHSLYAVPCQEVKSDKKSFKKYEMVTGGFAYHRRITTPDSKLGSRRIQNVIIINDQELKYVAFHETAVSRLLFTCADAMKAVKAEMPANIKPIFNWTEWHMYRSGQKNLRVRSYTHEKFKSDHAKNIDGLAATKKPKVESKPKAQTKPKVKAKAKKETA